MKKRFVRVFAVLFVVVTVMTSFGITASAASTSSVKNVGSGYVTVKISQSLLNKKGLQYAKVQLQALKSNGKADYDSWVHVTLRDNKGKWICEFNQHTGANSVVDLKLGDDHSVYRIYVTKYEYRSGNWKTAADDFIRLGKTPARWKINNPRDCSIA
jgi:hypothetical protein